MDKYLIYRTDISMISYLLGSLYQIYIEPLFLTHLAIFWTACFACFIGDIKAFVDLKDRERKYSRPVYESGYDPSQNIRGGYGPPAIVDGCIDWLLYIYATGRALYVQFCLLAPMIWMFLPLYSREPGALFTHSALRTFACCGLLEEVMFYYGHRLLHQPSMWKYHRLHHELVTPVAVASLYASTVENLLVNILPVLVAPLIAGLSIDLLWIWMVAATIAPVLSHSGFRVLEPVAKFHAIHHLSKHHNFSVLGILDRLHGTYSD